MKSLTVTQYVNLSLQIWGCVLTLIIIICLYLNKKANVKTRRIYVKLLLTNAGVMLFDALALFFRGGDGAFAYYAVRTANLFGFCFAAAVPTVFLHYLTCCFKNSDTVDRTPLYISRVMLAVQFILYLFNLRYPVFYDIDQNNIYSRLDLYPLTFIPAFLNIVLAFYLLNRYKKNIDKGPRAISIFYLLLPIPVFLIQMFVYGLNLVNFASMTIMTVLFLFIQSEQANEAMEIEKKLIRQELALAESNNALVLSQIQPHFLYNALTSIYSLCDVKPEAAKEAISAFSKYLRGNLDSIKQTHMISFAEELNHLQAYLALEKMRFDDYLEVVYDIKATEFFIPPLTVQPLVENAVNHGISDLPEGGIITISAEKKEGAYEIRISDNGIGFDQNAVPEDGRSHIGIPNVRNRLKIMCSGSLNIISSPSHGTTAIIRIPIND